MIKNSEEFYLKSGHRRLNSSYTENVKLLRHFLYFYSRHPKDGEGNVFSLFTPWDGVPPVLGWATNRPGQDGGYHIMRYHPNWYGVPTPDRITEGVLSTFLHGGRYASCVYTGGLSY